MWTSETSLTGISETPNFGISRALVVRGCQCYERKNEEIIQCPYWEKEQQAYCTFEEDSDAVLLDDQVKICGINEAHEIELTDEEPEEKQPSGHRWSGWPGAWCLDCGMKDPTEYCQANHEQPCNRDECDPGDCEHREGLYDPYKEDDE